MMRIVTVCLGTFFLSASALVSPGGTVRQQQQQRGGRLSPQTRGFERWKKPSQAVLLGGDDVVSSASSLSVAYEFAGSYWSLYATLGLYVLSFPGLYSLIKRATKVDTVQKVFVFEDDERELKEIAGEVMAYMTANNYDVADAGETITFRGVMENSKSQAFFLSFCTFVGLASLALVLQVQFPAIGSAWFLLTLTSPYAGVYYWQNAQNDNEFKVKLEDRAENVDTTDTTKALTVRGGKEDVERMARVMQLQEEGMVRVTGIFEGALK
mmetsp:Transcript_29238/g.94329  ORF Transcript_29238/g.94329 Transcript_29238/m.94329 type:complete len:268 (+) Transcript_29238:18-821(+)